MIGEYPSTMSARQEFLRQPREFQEAVAKAVQDARAHARRYGPSVLRPGTGIGGGAGLSYDAISLSGDTHNDWYHHARGSVEAKNAAIEEGLRRVHEALEGGHAQAHRQSGQERSRRLLGRTNDRAARRAGRR